MTSNSPDEAIHFRGKTLTPESPRPLHIPEPSNIPVLENQMDPVFNDTSTYEKLSTYQDDEQPSQPESDGELYKSANEDDNRIQAALLNMAQESGTMNAPSTLDAQSAAAHVPLSSQPNAAPYHQMDVPISAANTTTLSPSMANPEVEVALSNSAQAETGVDFQNLLDNLSPSASTAPSGAVVHATTSSPADNPVLQEHKQPQPPAVPDHSYALPAGLPPRPPTQEMPDLNPNYPSTANISDYHPLGIQASNAFYVPQPQGHDQPSNASIFIPGVAPGTSSGANGLPPPPLATFQQLQPQQKPVPAPEATTQSGHKSSRSERYSARPGGSPDEDVFWGDEVQKIYDEFLREERAYVTEGLWDRFPYGSRLFVGNLPSERVTKRDLFHVFHNFLMRNHATGLYKLSKEALSEAGRSISKYPNPRKVPDRGQAILSLVVNHYKGGLGHHQTTHVADPPIVVDCAIKAVTAMIVHMTISEEVSVTLETKTVLDAAMTTDPLGHHLHALSATEIAVFAPEIALQTGLSDVIDAGRDLPIVEIDGIEALAREHARDLQILAADDVDMSFAYHVENSFKTRGLRTNILVLSRIPVDVAIQRQMDEGVFAVVRLTRSQQYSGKVTLLMFDRSAGAASKPRSMEYPDLDLHVAVEMTVQMHAVRRTGVAPNYYPPNTNYPVPSLRNQFPQPLPHAQPAMPALPQTNQIANLIQTLDGPALQSLLSTLQQTQSAPQAAMPSLPVAPNASNPVDLASLLNNAHRQQNPLATAQNQGPQPQAANPFGLPLSAQPSNRLDPNLLALLAKGTANGAPIQGGQAAVGPHVQNIVNQLAKWKQ
ncbi:hypothetical protein ZTR_00344 [Talaromyces verruculosus]|nr:hypothetical protein ZTR_00344 [Talaromyces verruculosus]